MPEIGQTYTFQTCIGGDWLDGHGKPVANVHTGRIVYINRDHRYFLVVADMAGREIRECFKF